MENNKTQNELNLQQFLELQEQKASKLSELNDLWDDWQQCCINLEALKNAYHNSDHLEINLTNDAQIIIDASNIQITKLLVEEEFATLNIIAEGLQLLGLKVDAELTYDELVPRELQ